MNAYSVLAVLKKVSNQSGTFKGFDKGTGSVPVFEQLLSFFARHPVHTCLVAYSGGLDSHVLLHSLVQLQQHYPTLISAVRAVHIDHGLQAVSADWAKHCEQVCGVLGVEFEAVHLTLEVPVGSSVEAVARTGRYAVFERHLRADEVLLTAHHQDDQAETVLLNLLRGSGPEGLAAMPESRPFGQSALLRPLLNLSRAQLANYAEVYQLDWIEDPSNESLAFDRNYLRHEVLPAFRARWPATDRVLARAAQWQSEAAELQNELLAVQVLAVQGTQTGTLSVSGLLACSVMLRKALLRHWLKAAGFSNPPVKKLQHILSDVLPAKPDAQPCVKWPGCEVRRFRDDVHVMAPLPEHDSQQVLDWVVPYDDCLIRSLGLVVNRDGLGELLPLLLASGQVLQIRFRQGGETLRRAGITISLKQLFQDRAVLPWLRDRIPLVYAGEQLIMIPGLFVLAAGDF